MTHGHSNGPSKGHDDAHYKHLLLMSGLSFLAMYALMYAMVNTWANVYANLNQLYMAGLMTAPMVLLELWFMRSMYHNRKLNRGIAAAATLVLAGFWLLVRQQAAISDTQFLRSMIPHHAGAILMCEQAPVEDAEVVRLCKSIVASQQAEIDQMKGILARLGK